MVRTLEQRIHHPQTGASSGAVRLLSGFSGLENSARKGDGRDGGSLRFLNPCCDQVLFAVAVPTVVDRYVQQAVAQVLTPIFEEQFHDHSYGFRPNRCAQQAVLKALEMMNDGHNWIVDIDLAKFFDTVDHDKLMTIFGRTVKDGDVISLVRKFLVSGVMIDDEYEDTIVGTPQGGNISPLLANIMLNELDKELEARGWTSSGMRTMLSSWSGADKRRNES